MAGDGYLMAGTACKWCGRPVDAGHGAGVCLRVVDRELEASVTARKRRDGTIKAHIDALDEYMRKRAPGRSRSRR